MEKIHFFICGHFNSLQVQMLYVKVYDCLNDKQNCEEKKHNTFFKSYQVLNCPNWLVGWIGGKEVEVKKQKVNLLT